jgi:prevent-host-death family protein
VLQSAKQRKLLYGFFDASSASLRAWPALAMVRLGLREANQGFSKAIKAVRARREVILTDRGKPIAVIKPLPQGDTEDAVIRRLEAEGLLRPALKRGPMPELRWRPILIKGSPLSETIRQEREER